MVSPMTRRKKNKKTPSCRRQKSLPAQPNLLSPLSSDFEEPCRASPRPSPPSWPRAPWCRSARAAVKVSAKYGDESRYFDLDVSSFLPFLFRSILSSFFPLVRPERDCSFLTLSLSLLLPLLLLLLLLLPLLPSLSPQDLENTAGSWDMYGQADGARYPGLQAEFFERAAAPVVRREALLGLLGLAFPSAVVAWGIKGAKDVKLPITVGPQKPAALGPRDKL